MSEFELNDDDDYNEKKWNAKMQDDKKGISKIKSVCCIRIDENWSMKSQITIATIVLFLLIFVLLVTLTTANILQVSNIMQDSQNKLFISQSQKNLVHVSNRFKRLVQVHFKAVQNDAINFQKVYLSVSSQPQSNPDDFQKTPFICTNQSLFQQNQLHSEVCYSAFGNSTTNKTINAENQVFIQSAQHFNQIHPLIVNQNYTYLTNIQYTGFWTADQLIYFYPCLQYPPEYRPQLRIWYIEMNNIDISYRANNTIFMEFHMSQVYSNYLTHNAQISMTKILFDKNYKYKGATGSGIDISKFAKLFQIQFAQFTAMLINFDGNLYISPYFNASQDGNDQLGFYFFNQSVTGFNLDDWNQVMNLANTKSITHNCSIFNLDTATNLLCRWNQLTQRNELIFATRLKVLNYYVVILLDEMQFLDQLYIQKQQIEGQLIQISVIVFCLIGAVFVLLLGIVLMMISYIFKPMHNLSTFCSDLNQDNKLKVSLEVKQIKLQNIVSKGVFYPLTQRFYNLLKQFTSLRTNRNSMCNQIENLQYQKQDRHKMCLDKHLKQLKNLSSKYEPSSQWEQGKQSNFLDKYQLNQISCSPREVNQVYNQKILTTQNNLKLQQIKSQLDGGGGLDRSKLLKLIFYFYKKQ